jgi:hypothetical protein
MSHDAVVIRYSPGDLGQEIFHNPSINHFPSSSGAHELDDSNRRLAAESPSQPRDRGIANLGRLADNEQDLLQQFSLK